jgi:NAD(P)-dependent dehydrogenase (short-subunit alcohol dehydrogenase family)
VPRAPQPAEHLGAVIDGDRWRLAGSVALVTGAGRGLGVGCAQALAAAGASVLLVARTAAEVEAAAQDIVAAGGRAQAHAADVTDEAQVATVVEAAQELGPLRVCVNSAGTNRPGPARTYPTSDWDDLFAVNVRATFLMCRAFGDALLERGAPGSVINMSSQMGVVGYPGRVAYCATKHAVEGLTKALGVEWAPHGIRVNAVAPTFVETPMTRPILADPEFRAEVMRRLPTGELATIEQVADAVRYLACDASGSVTGTVLRVDGGWTAW